MLKEALLVGAGGFAGSVCRYLVSVAMTAIPTGTVISPGTITVNITGSLLIGVLMVVTGNNYWHYLLVVGFCGGFTTFSTFSAELLALAKGGHYLHSFMYVILSVTICLAVVWLGMYVGHKILK